MEFQAWPKIPRLNREMTVTEKIDGTNAAVIIEKVGMSVDFMDSDYQRGTLDASGAVCFVDLNDEAYLVGAQSRKRLITPGSDNYGFAAWIEAHAARLVELLGEGRHFGEWWGKGIQRGYDMEHKAFSLFHVDRYPGLGTVAFEDSTLDTVPVLYRGEFNTNTINALARTLYFAGSQAAPGYDRPEGVVAFHTASRQVYKAFCDPADEAAPKTSRDSSSAQKGAQR